MCPSSATRMNFERTHMYPQETTRIPHGMDTYRISSSRVWNKINEKERFKIFFT